MNTHYSKVQTARDMAPYAAFYTAITKRISERARDGRVIIAEAGSRYGVSARIIRSALSEHKDWKLVLMDPFAKPEAETLTGDEHVVLIKERIDTTAATFEDSSVDLLHIDVDENGEHKYGTARKILMAFWNKLKADGEVILHDCTEEFPGILRLATELNKLGGWELKQCEPHQECPIAAPAHLKRIPTVRVPKITAVIPVITDEFLPGILGNIRDAEPMKPIEIIVIDNGDGVAKPVCTEFSDLPIKYLPQKKNIGVNASWNIGLKKAKTGLVSILNDDLVIPPQFFTMISESFESYPQAGIVIPQTHRAVGQVVRATEKPMIESMKYREGWAFTIRKRAVKQLIPAALFTFFGDDWLFGQVHAAGWWLLKISNLPIYHNVGISQDRPARDKLGLPTLEHEKEVWAELEPKRAEWRKSA